MQLEHHSLFDLEEQYGLSTSSKKGKEVDIPPKNDETSAKLAKLGVELKLMKGGVIPHPYGL